MDSELQNGTTLVSELLISRKIRRLFVGTQLTNPDLLGFQVCCFNGSRRVPTVASEVCTCLIRGPLQHFGRLSELLFIRGRRNHKAAAALANLAVYKSAMAAARATKAAT